MAVGGTAAVAQNAGYAHLVDPNRKWYNNRRLIALHAWIFLFLLTSCTNGFDGSLMNSFQSLGQWETYFNHPSGGGLGLLNAIQNIGSLAGYPFAPYLSDGLGRRPTIWIGAVIMLVGVAVQSSAYNLGMFIGARFCVGFGLTFAANASPMLVTEISYPPYRAPLTSVYNSLWHSGNVIASWTTFGTSGIRTTWSWRIPSLMQGLPSVLQVILIFFAPESPRWLISKGKDSEGLRTLAYYHADGDEQDPLVQYEYQEIKAAINIDRQASKNIGWKSLVATRGNRKRIIIIIAIAWFSQWSGNGLVSYYLNKVFDTIGITSQVIQLLITGILAVWNLVLAVGWAAAFFLASAGGCLVFFIMQTVCSAQYAMHKTAAFGHAYIAFIFLYSFAYDLAFSPLIVTYSVEILPYSLRAKGFNVFNIVISLALIFNQYVNPIALEKLAWKYYLVYCCWIAFEVVFLYFTVVETKNRTLEETAALFDGEDVVLEVTEIAQIEQIEVHEDHGYDEKRLEKA